MALFRRASREAEPAAAEPAAPHPVTAFWAWWADEGHRIDPHGLSPATDELTRLVRAIHPDLTWHFGAGSEAEHRLTVSAGGAAEVRPSAERWFRAAPAPDATWEFSPSQQADPAALTNALEIGGHRLELAATTFRIEVAADEFRVHIGVHHPAFAELPENVQGQVTFLVLDWLLGEDAVERWLGRIEPLPVAPVGSARESGDAVRAAVASIASQRDPDAWVLGQWQDDEGMPGLAIYRNGLRWLDHPTLDRHQSVTAHYVAQPNGLPADSGALDLLRELESQLEAALGSRGILIGHESHRGLRTFHAYTDGEDQNADAELAAWASGRGVTVEAAPDPAWSRVRHLTG
ncbi:hypothetical protein [Jiangella mangrovi]|uniref:DUF695 domain-containing protein n=1 Tax=Jiangella mangrovi TaxID=1524084 RepID=A0A7W9GQ94_9ACTN|nr:hypothetical protein [Jiangella mangrovi]MBB5788040.1 hypothetical protein [Jiangella mangrovi]